MNSQFVRSFADDILKLWPISTSMVAMKTTKYFSASLWIRVSAKC